MKKLIALTLALLLTLSLCVCAASAEEATDTPAESLELVMGALSLLNMSEEEYLARTNGRILGLQYLVEQGVYHGVNDVSDMPELFEVIFFDTLDAMLMALEANDIDSAEIPQCTADYLCAHNDKLVPRGTYDLSDADDLRSRSRTVWAWAIPS